MRGAIVKHYQRTQADKRLKRILIVSILVFGAWLVGVLVFAWVKVKLGS